MITTNSGKIPLRIAQDPTISAQPNRMYVAQKPPLDCQLLKTNADSFSASNVSVTINPPKSTFLDKLVMMNFHGRWTFYYTPQAPGVPLFNAVTGVAPWQYLGGTDAVNYCPLQSNCSSAQININGTSNSVELNQFLPAVSRYGFLPPEKEGYDSTFPSYQDQFRTFAEGFGTNRNSLGDYGDNALVNPRGGFGYNVISDDPVLGVAIVQVQWSEPLMVSPFNINAKQEVGFFDVQTVTLNLGLSNMEKAWSHDLVNNPAVINSSAFEWVSNPIFLTRHATPISPTMADPVQLHEFTNIQRFTTSVPLVAAGDSRVVALQNVRLNAIPEKIYIFFQKSKATKTVNDAECYAYISNINVNIGNKSAQLASYTSEYLYKICSQNGYQLSWRQHQHDVGSVICINVGKDLPLEINQTTGLREDINLQISATITNQQTVDVAFDGQLIILTPGIFSVGRDGSSSLTIGPVYQGDVFTADLIGAKSSNMVFAADNENFYAGRIDWKSTGKKIISGIKDYGPKVLKATAPALRTGTSLVAPRFSGVVDEALKMVGAGYSAGEIKKILSKKHGLPAKDIAQAIASIRGKGYMAGQYLEDGDYDNLVSGTINDRW